MKRSLAGEMIGVLGLARSGLAAAQLALRQGARVYASDSADGPAARAAAERIREQGGDAEAGRHDADRLARCDRIVLSPGIPPSASILHDPRVAAVPVVPEVEFAWELLGAPAIAITGTNGKTTVTLLISHLLESAGMRAPAGGNVGTALSEIALRDATVDWAVVEVSSFQLGGIRDFAPRIGVVTNLAPDHLDRYATVDDYYADKARLFRNATAESVWVLNGEDPAVLALPDDAPGERLHFRTESEPAAGEPGGWLSADGWLALRTGVGTAAAEERLLPATELRITGAHNVANALAAALAARVAGAEPRAIVAALRTFEAPPHRCQPVAEVRDVLWINDSKATNIASTRVALKSMARPTILLLGGRHKGEPYSELLPDLKNRVRRVVAFGEAGERVVADLGRHLPVDHVDGSFEEVIRHAAGIAHAGDAVLLSPACSSYDMFTDYEARGRRFAELAVQQ